jgi:hypothetical protein
MRAYGFSHNQDFRLTTTGTDSYRFKRTLTHRNPQPEQRAHQPSPST